MSFNEELNYDGRRAWYGYLAFYQLSSHFEFRHKSKRQRTVKCKGCGVVIPKTVPRVYVSGSWYYGKGNYCLKCALTKILPTIEQRKAIVNRLQENLQELNSLKEVIEKCIEKEDYKEAMALGYMITKIR